MFLFQLHAVSHIQNMERKGSLLLRHSAPHFPLKLKVLSGRTQRRAIPRHRSEETKILSIQIT